MDEAVQQVTAGLFRQFMALRTNPGLIQAKAQVAVEVGAAIKAHIRGLTDGRSSYDDTQQ